MRYKHCCLRKQIWLGQRVEKGEEFRKEWLRGNKKAVESFFNFNYILLIMLLQLSQFLLCPLLPRNPDSFQQSPHHCLYPWVTCISSLAIPFPILYFISPRLFCNYQFELLNPSTFSPISPVSPFPLAIIKVFSGSMLLFLFCLFA